METVLYRDFVRRTLFFSFRDRRQTRVIYVSKYQITIIDTRIRRYTHKHTHLSSVRPVCPRLFGCGLSKVI